MADKDDSAALHDLLHGRLSETEAARLNEAIRSDPALKAEYRLVAALNETDTAPHPFPGEFGWARLSKAIDSEAPKRRVWHRSVSVWQAAACLVVAIFAWQVAIAPQLIEQSGDVPRYVTVTGQTGADAPSTARIAFVPEASEEAIRQLLRDADATIVNGPTALGFYTLGFQSDEDRDAGLERLGAEPAVVQFVDRE